MIRDDIVSDENVDIDKIRKKFNEYIEIMINDIKNEDYARFRDTMRFLLNAIPHLNYKVRNLEVEIKKIREEIFQNELTPKDLKEILLFDYDEE